MASSPKLGCSDVQFDWYEKMMRHLLHGASLTLALGRTPNALIDAGRRHAPALAAPAGHFAALADTSSRVR